MTFYQSFRTVLLSLCAVCVLCAPASAQQRVQIGDVLQRIDRLESEVTRLRVAPRGNGGDIAQLDQIEQELRRLTGIIERLEYDSRRATVATEKRLDAFEERLDAMEQSASWPTAQQPSTSTTDNSFTSVTSPPPLDLSASGNPSYGSEQITTPYQPQAAFQPQADSGFSRPFPGQQSPPVGQSADALYEEGIRLLNLGSFDQAGAHFEDLLAAYPQDPKSGQAQFWLGDMHFKLGRYEQAASAFLDSFRNWPEGAKAPDSLLKLGMTLATIGKAEEACLSFKQVVARYPGASPSLLRRADIESQRNRCG